MRKIDIFISICLGVSVVAIATIGMTSKYISRNVTYLGEKIESLESEKEALLLEISEISTENALLNQAISAYSQDLGDLEKRIEDIETAFQKQEFNPETPSAEIQESRIVVIDAGHQGSWVDMSDVEPVAPGSSEMKAKASTGTVGVYSNVPEYELTLKISQLLKEELINRGYQVVMTREDNDTAISNKERAELANDSKADAFIRIHANGSEDQSVQGALAMVPSENNTYVGYLSQESYALAESVLEKYCEKTGFGNVGILYEDTMTGMNWSKVPVMILEMGYMSNESDDTNMQTPHIQSLMAEGIADGIDNYFAQFES